jgi:hypothetical protein
VVAVVAQEVGKLTGSVRRSEAVARSVRRAVMTDEMSHREPASETVSGLSEPISGINPSADRMATLSASSTRSLRSSAITIW